MPETATDITASMRCPTCNATQVWSDECRRCKSDLRLLRQVIEVRQRCQQAALQALHEGQYGVAVRSAQQAYDLFPDANSRRLLATCHLLAGNSQEALLLARDVVE